MGDVHVNKNHMFSEVNLRSHGGNDGKLISIESLTEQLPFELKRIYYIFGVKKEIRRGFHAHKKLKQLLVCVSGSCEIELDDGIQKETVVLDSPATGLLIQQPVWRELSNFSDGAVLLVLASEHYDTEDYIWDYEEFRKFVSDGYV